MDSGLVLPVDLVDAASSLSPSIDPLSFVGVFRLAVDPLGLSGVLAPEPGILDFSEVLRDRDEPCVSDLENEGYEERFGPSLDAFPSLDGWLPMIRILFSYYLLLLIYRLLLSASLLAFCFLRAEGYG